LLGKGRKPRTVVPVHEIKSFIEVLGNQLSVRGIVKRFDYEIHRMLDRLRWPAVVRALPKHESLLPAGNRVEEQMRVVRSKEFVFRHVQHQHLRGVLSVTLSRGASPEAADH
jgi:hypothetical protein